MVSFGVGWVSRGALMGRESDKSDRQDQEGSFIFRALGSPQQSGWWVVPANPPHRIPPPSPVPFYLLPAITPKATLFYFISCLPCPMVVVDVGGGWWGVCARCRTRVVAFVRRMDGWVWLVCAMGNECAVFCVGHGGAPGWQVRADKVRLAMWVFFSFPSLSHCHQKDKEGGCGPGSRGCSSSSMLGGGKRDLALS